MPEITFESLDKVPEALRDIAKENENGGVTINVVGKNKLDEFRDNNIALATERDSLKTKVAALSTLVGENPDEFAVELEDLRKTKQQVSDGKLKASDAIEQEVSNRVASMKDDYERRLQQTATETAAWKAKAGENDAKFKTSVIKQAVTDVVMNPESGVEARALPDIITRAAQIFVVGEDNRIVPKDGEATIYGSDGATPMTMTEWVETLKEQAPYFFKNSTGGGADGSVKSGLPGNFSAEDWAKLPAKKKLELANKAA